MGSGLNAVSLQDIKVNGADGRSQTANLAIRLTNSELNSISKRGVSSITTASDGKGGIESLEFKLGPKDSDIQMTVIGGPGSGAVGFNAACHESESAMRLVSQYKDGSGQLSLVRPRARAPWEQSIESLDSYMLDIGTLGASLGARRGIAALWNGTKALVEAAASKTRGAAVGNSAADALLDLPPYYRGLHPGHPGYSDALKGIAMPQDISGTLTPEQAVFGNLGGGQFTNWTPFLEVAKGFARPNGVVMEAPRAAGPWAWPKNQADPREAAVLLKGRVEGLRVTPLRVLE